MKLVVEVQVSNCLGGGLFTYIDLVWLVVQGDAVRVTSRQKDIEKSFCIVAHCHFSGLLQIVHGQSQLSDTALTQR